MIMRGKTPRALTWTGFLAVGGLALLLLPILPILAQEEPKRGKDDPKPDVKKEEDPRQTEDIQRAKAELEKARAELEKARADMQRAEEKLRHAQDQLAKISPQGPGKGNAKLILVIEGRDGKIQKIELPPGNDLRGAIELRLQGEGAKDPVQSRPKGVDPGKGPVLPGSVPPPGGHRDPVDPPPGQGNPRFQPPPGKGPGGQPVRDNTPDLERRLEQLIREVEDLRRQMQRNKPDGKTPLPGDKERRNEEQLNQGLEFEILRGAELELRLKNNPDAPRKP